MATLRDYIYVDIDRVFMYLEQATANRRRFTRTIDRLKFGALGLSAELSFDTEARRGAVVAAVAMLESFLERHGLVIMERPSQLINETNRTDDRPRFIKETMSATKVTFPQDLLANLPDLQSLSVWVSDPNPRDLGDEANWEYCGSFLFLVEGRYDNVQFTSVMSGCSALQAVVNIAQGHDLLKSSADGEPFGRDTYVHPIDKLQGLGIRISTPRTITALYKRRYMTDEQCFTHNGRRYRSCDLLGYPIYICAND